MAVFYEVPPPHVPSYWVHVPKITFPIGGWLWVLCYILIARENLRSKSYGMPLFALANNFAWEVVYAFFFVDIWQKQLVFAIWVVVDAIIVYGTMKHGGNEWMHTPIVKNNLGKIILLFTIFCLLGHWAFIRWWFDYGIGKKPGKFYLGVEGIDTTELKFWSGEVCQMVLSAASLAQLVVRQHTGGVSWAIW